MVREFAGDYMRQCGCAHVVSFPPDSNRTPEQERRYRRSLREGFKKKNAERDRKIKEYPALVLRGIITPLDTKYQARKRQQEEDVRIHAERKRRLHEMRQQRRQESASSIVVEKSEELANRTSGASTQEQQQAIARAAANTLGFKP